MLNVTNVEQAVESHVRGNLPGLIGELVEPILNLRVETGFCDDDPYQLQLQNGVLEWVSQWKEAKVREVLDHVAFAIACQIEEAANPDVWLRPKQHKMGGKSPKQPATESKGSTETPPKPERAKNGFVQIANGFSELTVDGILEKTAKREKTVEENSDKKPKEREAIVSKREIARFLKSVGYRLFSSNGPHVNWRGPNGARIVVPHGRGDLPRATTKSILKELAEQLGCELGIVSGHVQCLGAAK